LWRFLLVIFILILAILIFIETPFGQNWLAKQITKKLSRELQTKISFKHVSFSLFNKMNIEDLLVEDQKHDTLLFAGNFQVRITDWFFLKNKADIKYVGIENSVIHLQRNDSTWNYQFIVDYFTPTPSKSSQKNAGIQLDLKKLSLKNVMLIQKDSLRGEDMVAAVGNLDLDANEINFSKKNIEIISLDIGEPLFSLYHYDRKKVQTSEISTSIVNTPVAIDSLLQWNPEGWKMNIALLKINNGIFKDEKQTSQPILTYFDPEHIAFSSINGEFSNVKLTQDTFSAKMKLNAKERSGFLVRSMNSDVVIHPKGMFFNNLDLHTNNSIIRNYFAMTYDDFSDMDDFVHSIKLQSNLNEADVDSWDIAFFAPTIKNWEKKIKINGKVNGTIDDISGRNLSINADNTTRINGDIKLTGLPDIYQTFIDFKSNDLTTNYNDLIKFAPAVKKITQPDLARLGNIHFAGSFTGFINDFVTFGTIQTNLGTVKSDLNMKFAPGKEPLFSGNIETNNFSLGEFIHYPQIGEVSFSGIVKGHGVDINTLGIDMDATISELDYNGYKYTNITANGKLEKKLFNGFLSINDPNIKAEMNGLIAINGAQSKFDLLANVTKADLKTLNLTENNLSFNGKFNLDFTGDNIDNFLGTARITDANLINNGQRMSLDSLTITSDYNNGIKTLTANSNEFEGTISGNLDIDGVPAAIQLFLNKYYPSYVKFLQLNPQIKLSTLN
jgi:hypothetical protein